MRRATLIVCALLLTARTALALNPALDISQYAHTAWRVGDGFWPSAPGAIAQTPDGYLWVGTDTGLVRFDGIRAVRWQPPPSQALPSTVILNLLAGRDGTLWIGTTKGLASWKDEKLTQYDDFAGSHIGTILEDRHGLLWVTLARPTSRFWILCAIERGRSRCYGADDGGPGTNVIGLYEDRQGTLWAGAANGLWQWRPGPRRFYPLPPQTNGLQGFAETDDGGLLIAIAGGVAQVRDGRAALAYPFPRAMEAESADSLLRDRDGAIWIGTTAGGLVHVHRGLTDVFTQADGLSGDSVMQVFEDREGSIWVVTRSGVDRFRDPAVVAMSARQGLSNSRVQSVLAGSDGSIWVGTAAGLNRLTNNRVTVYRDRVTETARATRLVSREVREITGSGLPGGGINSLLEDRRGRVWVATSHGVGYIENDDFTGVVGLPGGVTRAIVEDSRNVWVANQDHGLYQVSPDFKIVRHVPWASLSPGTVATAAAADRANAGLWLAFANGRVINFVDGQIRASYGAGDGLGERSVNSLHLDSAGAVWAATDLGLSRVHNDRVTTLTRNNGLPCDAAQWLVDDRQSFWVGTSCGLVRIARSEIDSWAAAVDKGAQSLPVVQTTVFGSADGVRLYPEGSYFSAPAVAGADGRVWFMSPDGVSVLDPQHVSSNRVVPPPHIEQLTADRRIYDARSLRAGGLRLPPLPRDVQIDYTALSFVAPEKMQFRYMLEGRDRDWQDVGTRRQAFYDNLAPGNYRFRVTASNNNGAWNEADAVLDFAVAPAYYQTLWFQIAVAGAVVALLGAAYQYRVRRVARYYSMRLEARVEERTRIARDLHDTLLQSFQGVLLKFQATTYLLPDRPEEARKTLESVIEQASRAISEGRDAVQGLRSSTLATTDLARAIGLLGQQLAADHGGLEPPGLRVEVAGTPRDLAPLVQDEVYRIAGEAMRNAFQHATATRIEVEVHYDARQFRLRVRDDGKGIDPAVLAEGGRRRHFGLEGMHERASVVGGKLAVWSQLDSGCEIELTIPASIAYAKPAALHR